MNENKFAELFEEYSKQAKYKEIENANRNSNEPIAEITPTINIEFGEFFTNSDRGRLDESSIVDARGHALHCDTNQQSRSNRIGEVRNTEESISAAKSAEGRRLGNGSRRLGETSRRFHRFNDSQIWRINPQERISLQNLSKEAQEIYRHEAIKAYAQNRAILPLSFTEKLQQDNNKDTNQTLTNHTNNNTTQQENKSINHFKDKLKEFKEKQTEKQINNVNKNLER